MLFRKTGDAYLTNVLLSRDCSELFKLDTGSPFTIISIDALCRVLCNMDKEVVKKELISYDCVRCSSYTGHTSRLVPVYIRDVKLDDYTFNKFYCFVDVDVPDSSLLIGTDLISACTIGRTEAAYGIELSNLDFQSYETRFKFQCCTDDIHEIFELAGVRKSGSRLQSFFNEAKGGGLDKDLPIV